MRLETLGRELIKIFEGYTDAKDIELRLSLATHHNLIPKETIIFLDEVQEISDLITMSKFLVENTNYRYVMSGSLLGVELNDLRSAPVGYMHIIDMYPMDLEEFFIAVGVSRSVIDRLRDSFFNRIPVDDYIHQELLSLFNIYLIVGGMPEAVKKYIETNDLRKVAAVQRDIVQLYKKDFTKYNKKNKLILNEVYDAIPSELSEKNKRFFVNHIAGKVLFDSVSNNFIWLKNAGVALPVFNITEPKVPLDISEKRNLFKLFLSDVGLLTNNFSDGVKIKILNKDSNINNGAIYENFVAQELVTHGFDVYYFNSKKQGEVDFVVEYNGCPMPIEVKSGKDFKKHSALNNLLENKEYDISEAYILNNNNISIEGKKLYYPIYMVMFFKRIENENMIHRIDISHLK